MERPVAGQGALRLLPSSPYSKENSVSSYELPSKFKADRKSLRDATVPGVEVLKVTKQGKLQARRFAFSEDNRSILITTNRIRSVKNLLKYATQSREVTAKGIDISTIVRLQPGGLTNRFLMARAMGGEEFQNLDEDSTCLSIIFRASSSGGDAKSPQRFDTLDLIVPDDEEFDVLVDTLRDLMDLHDEEKRQYDQDFLFLQFHWIDLGKSLSDRITASEWTSLCDRMNVPVKKTHIMTHYKEFLSDMESEEGLTLAETSHLLEEVREIALAVYDLNVEDDPCVQVWKSVLESDPVPALKMEQHDGDADLEMEMEEGEATISAVAFLSFVRSEQKQYTTTMEEVHDCLLILNKQVTADAEGDTAVDDKKKDAALSERIPRSKFIAFLTSDSNDLMNPHMGDSGYEEMHFPLSHYWINTSHDTYLAKIADFGMPKNRENVANAFATDLQMYTAALLRGVRAIEVDTWDGFYGNEGPIVARRQPVAATELPIKFADVLRVLRTFLLSNPESMPILLCIGNHCSLTNQEIMAKELDEILGAVDLLYTPPVDVAVSGNLPSPESLRGKVVIKGKRPKKLKEGATVMNNDFDDEIDVADDDDMLKDILADDQNEEDEEAVGFIVGFEASGPVRSTDQDAAKRSAVELLEAAAAEEAHARMEAERANDRAEELKLEAESAEEHAVELTTAAGLTMSQIKSRAQGDVDDEGTEVDLTEFQKRISEDDDKSQPNEDSDDGSASGTEEGMEVQDFFEETVEGAREDYSTADAELLEAADAEATGALRLQDAQEALSQAQVDLSESYEREKQAEAAAERAAADARARREHAETARERVETVREMLRNWKNNATSAETVVHTAMTEAKISDQRAADTEARASRAAANAEKDKARCEHETQKEELLENEAAKLHELSIEASNEARGAREKMEKAATHLDKVNEQIKLIERSSHYKKEITEGKLSPSGSRDDDSSERTPRHVSRFVAKHAAKLQQREECTKALIEATNENAESEKRRRRAQQAFEDKARQWKMQADVSSKARKQADRSAAIAEELVEHAEEEREAAALRKVAHEKAEKNVEQSDSYRASVQSQLMEAEKASAEASRLALEARSNAEELARRAADAKDHSIPFSTLEARKLQHKEALRAYDETMERKKQAEAKASEAKRLLDTSSEVLSSAKREVAAEIHRMNAERLAERSAIHAYNKAVLSRKQATHASSLTALAETTWDEKKAALSHARDYKEKQDKIARISIALASMTLLDSHRFKYWEKSLTLPCTQMHSFSHGLVLHMLDLDAQVKGLLQFSRDHIYRSFPSWKAMEQSPCLNYNPVAQWAVGCQLVSMNFQSADEHLLANDGRFRLNGSSGYVLKPHYLLKDGHPAERWQHWRFEILSGRCLPKPSGRKGLPLGPLTSSTVNPYVRVTLYDGVSGKDSRKIAFTTQPVERNGLNPVWASDEFEVAVERPSIAVLLFTVWDKHSDGASDFIAGAGIPVTCLREGYRSVPLFDSLHTKCGPYAFASLFVRAHKIS